MINQYLAGFDCSCGKHHSCPVDYVAIEHGAISHLTRLCEKYQNILVVADENTFRAAGTKTEAALQGEQYSKLIFDGYLKVYASNLDEDKDKLLPELAEGEILDAKEVTAEQKFTEPPSRFTEASLVKELEDKNIGRPSTYAPIVATLLDRKYISKDKKALVPTELGFIVIDMMANYFKEIVDVSFTAQMEDQLDKIEEGSVVRDMNTEEYFAAKDPASAAAINASSTIMAPSETKGSILSVFKQKVKLFASRENLSEMLSYSDINLETIGERPTAVFIVIQDEKKTYHSLVTILLKQIYETLISVAQKHGGKLPVRTNFLLDEFANMPPLKDVTTMITAARSRAIRFTMIIQNFAQLDSVYGKEDAETIRGNCGNIIYLITTELKALEEISKMCGEVKSKKDDKTASTPLVTVSDLQRMKQFEVIILRIRKQPFKTKFTPYFQLDWGEKYPTAKYPTRQKVPVQTFDIKEFVKNQKKKKLLEMMNSADGDKKTLPSNLPPIDLMRQMDQAHQEKPMPDFLTRKDEPFETKKEYQQPEMEMGRGILGRASTRPIAQPTSFDKTQDDDDDFGFNVDELIKKIDAKIAEIEAEEKKSKEETVSQTASIPKPVMAPPSIEEKIKASNESAANTTEILDVQPVIEIKEELPKLQPEPVKPTINLDIPEDNEDDDFFDDFFDN